MSQANRLTVTPANVASLCAGIRRLAREGAKCIVYVADGDAAWDETSLEIWRREHQRLATWIIGARSAGRELPDLPAWQAIEAHLVRRASSISPDADGLSGGRPTAGFPASAGTDVIPTTSRRLFDAQVAAVRELCTAVGRPARRKAASQPWAKVAMLAAAVTGLAACQQNGPMNVKPDASSAGNQTRDAGMGGGICAIDFGRDAQAPADGVASGGNEAGDGRTVDTDQADAADTYAPIGGIC